MGPENARNTRHGEDIRIGLKHLGAVRRFVDVAVVSDELIILAVRTFEGVVVVNKRYGILL